MSDFEYRPGLVFKSRYALYQYIVRPRKGIYASDGTEIDVIPELLAEFGIAGEEFSYTDPDTSEYTTGANITGHYFDLDVQAEQKGWSDEDRALVAKVLLRNQPKFAGDYQLHSARPVPAPWPTYDSTPHGKIVELAGSLGLAVEALTYEKQNKKRPTVVAGLEASLESVAVEEPVSEDLIAA